MKRGALVAGLILSLSASSLAGASAWPDLSQPAPAVGGGEHDAAVVVGIQRYLAVPGVPGARRNAKDWYAYLAQTRGVAPKDIDLRVSIDDTAKDDILRAATRAAGRVGTGGTLWFVFIGHGAPSADGKDGLLVGVDAQQTADSLETRSVRRDELLKILSKSRAKRILVVLDACFSGRDNSGRTLAKGLQPLMTVLPLGAADPRIAVLTAAKGDQFAGPLPGTDRPAFSYLVLGGLRGWAARAKGAEVSADDLWHYAKDVIEATVHGREQTPDVIGNRSLDAGVSAGEKGPDLAKLELALAGNSGGESGGGFAITAENLPSVPTAQAPGALDQAAPAMNFSNVDVAALGAYNQAYELDKNAAASAQDKSAKWRQLAQDYPQYADMAGKRAAQWDAYVAQWEAQRAARRKREEAMYKDWGKLGALLGYAVVPEASKEAWSKAFLDAYWKSPGLDPKMAKAIAPYVPAQSRMRGALEALSRKPMSKRDQEREQAAAVGVSATSVGKAGIQWVRIPGGTFTMGSSDYSDAQPHQVTVKSFQMAKTLVTNKQYKACVAAGACTAPSDPSDYPGGNDNPVVNVDWNQAKAFSTWVGGRLPSEAEWEYAARSAGKDWSYPWGDETATCDNSVIRGCGYNATAPVCSKPSGNTKQGLCDMAGNAWEWVEDWYHGSYNGAPTDGSAWEDAGSYRVDRGGSCYGDAANARSADRGIYNPGNRYFDLGFRPAR